MGWGTSLYSPLGHSSSSWHVAAGSHGSVLLGASASSRSRPCPSQLWWEGGRGGEGERDCDRWGQRWREGTKVGRRDSEGKGQTGQCLPCKHILFPTCFIKRAKQTLPWGWCPLEGKDLVLPQPLLQPVPLLGLDHSQILQRRQTPATAN